MADHADNTGSGRGPAEPGRVLLAEEAAGSRPALANGRTGSPAPALSDEELAATIHAELAKRLGQPGLAGELGGNPKAELPLVGNGRIEESVLGEIHAWASGLARLDDEDLGACERFPEVSHDFLASHDCLPIAWNGSETLLAVATPYGLGQLAYLWQTLFQRAATFALARPAVVERYLTSTYDMGQADTAAAGDATEETLRDLAREAPIVRLVNDMFNRAAEMGASDIHIEPGETEIGRAHV